MAKTKRSQKGFVASIVILIIGMTIGFLLLGSVYEGPTWVKALGFTIYLFIVFFLVKFSSDFAKKLSKCNKDDVMGKK